MSAICDNTPTTAKAVSSLLKDEGNDEKLDFTSIQDKVSIKNEV